MCAIGLFVSIIVGLIPAAVYGWFVYWLDRHEKEPWWLLALVFLWGAVPAFIMAFVAQLILDIPTTWLLADNSLASELAGGALWAPITEEIAKGLGLILVLVLARREMDSILDGIVYGAMAGLGFAFTENILYFWSALAEEGWGGWAFVVLLRTLPFGLNHALFTGLTGAGLGIARYNLRGMVKLAAPVCGLVAGMLFHSVHNVGASLSATNWLAICFSFLFDWTGILMLAVLVALIWRQERNWLAEQLPGEVSAEVLHTLTAWREWRRKRWGVLLHAGLAEWRRLGQIRQTATELAFKKQQLARLGPDANTQSDIDRHRKKLGELGATER